MATHKDWIPQNHEELHDQAVQTFSYLTPAVRLRIGLGAETPVGKWYDLVFTGKCNDFCTAFDNWKNPATRTPVITRILHNKEKDFVSAYRILYNGALRKNPLVTDDDLLSMGLPPHSDGPPHPSPIAEDYPWSKTRTELLRHMIIDFGSSETSRAKPEGQHGAEFVYIVSEEEPEDISKLIHSVFDTRTPIDLEFTEEERGKHFWYAVRWENTRGEKGPWSPILSAIIP